MTPEKTPTPSAKAQKIDAAHPEVFSITNFAGDLLGMPKGA